MPGLADILASLALALPAASLSATDASGLQAFAGWAHTGTAGAPNSRVPERTTPPYSTAQTPLESLDLTVRQSQIRIEQRVYVRIAPRRASTQRNMLAQLPSPTRPTRYKENKAKRCVKVERIAGVETGSGNRLLLFLQDAEILSLNLEKACRARDFYSGFYVEQNEDGKLCVARDTLQSRNGARCDIERMMKLKAIEE